MAHATTPDIRNIKVNEPGACQHCGALVFGDTLKCSQCRRFPVKIHSCPRCKAISAAKAANCWKCGRVFAPYSDYL